MVKSIERVRWHGGLTWSAELPEPATAAAVTSFWKAADDDPQAARPWSWNLRGDFRIQDGLEQEVDGALSLSVWVGEAVAPFPDDQRYGELSAHDPMLGDSQGVLRVSFVIDPDEMQRWQGVPCAVLHAGPDVRLQQQLDLSGARSPLTLHWVGTQEVCGSQFPDEPFFMQVVVRDLDGMLLETLYRYDAKGTDGRWGQADLSAWAGRTVLLSFEQCAGWSHTMIDRVSVADPGREFVVNGEFTRGGAGWLVRQRALSQHVCSGVRELGGLQVQRWFYTQPDLGWGRMVDVFANPSDLPIDAIAIYHSQLGSQGAGRLYETPGTAARAVTMPNGGAGVPAKGLVFGAVDGMSFSDDDGWLTGCTPHKEVFFRHDISVPPGGQVALAHFLIQTPPATVDAEQAEAVDALAAEIARQFRRDPRFTRGMTALQRASVRNF